jgi:hypothetical protein
VVARVEQIFGTNDKHKTCIASGGFVTNEGSSSGDAFPSDCAIIEVRVAELKQLFNSIDPSPFLRKDLDPRAEEFIVGWCKDYPPTAQLAMLILVDCDSAP